MSDITIRRVEPDERKPYLQFVLRNFHEWYGDEVLDTWLPVMAESRYDVAMAGDQMVGSIAAMHRTLSVPGGEIGCAAVTAVTVRTDHRRRGLLTAMMDRVFDEARQEGLGCAALYVSEGGIYGRFGYGPAVQMRGIEVASMRAMPQRTADVSSVRVVDATEARRLAPDVYADVARQRGGLLGFSDAWWDLLTIVDNEEERDGWTPRHYAAVGDDGVIAYRTRDKGGEDDAGRLKVEYVFTRDAVTFRALWAFIASVDLVGTIEIGGRPLDDPMLHLLPDEARIRMQHDDSLWVRLLDVPACLSARAAGADGSVVLEVSDRQVASNAGRWRVTGGDTLTCESTSESADLVLDVADLSSVYLGGVRTTTLVDAGRVEQPTAGAAATLDRMLATDRAPWAPLQF